MRRTFAALVAALVVVLGLAAPTQAGENLPDLYTAPTDPPGANDWSCVPTAQRPTPVIFVHGTFGDRKHLLERMSRKLKEKPASASTRSTTATARPRTSATPPGS